MTNKDLKNFNKFKAVADRKHTEAVKAHRELVARLQKLTGVAECERNTPDDLSTTIRLPTEAGFYGEVKVTYQSVCFEVKSVDKPHQIDAMAKGVGELVGELLEPVQFQKCESAVSLYQHWSRNPNEKDKAAKKLASAQYWFEKLTAEFRAFKWALRFEDLETVDGSITPVARIEVYDDETETPVLLETFESFAKMLEHLTRYRNLEAERLEALALKTN